jgi:AraC-like DNA-binding protein
MDDLTRLPLVKPELLLSSEPPPPPPGPVRFALPDWPERQRPAVLREFFARLGFRYDIDPLPDVPFHVDLSLNALPGLVMAAGKLHGSRNRRTRQHIEEGTDDAILIVNLKGPHLIEQRDKELVLGDGEAAFVSAADPSSFTHKPPGNILALRFPKARFAPLLRAPDDCYMRRIPNDAQALTLLTNYVGMAWDERTTASAELQHLMVTHVYDLMSLMVGATRDAEHVARDCGLRAARLHAIKQDIARNLENPNLSVAALADRHRCTPRLVQRLFEMEGTTFTEYVLEQRLARAHRLLVDPRREGEKISTLVYDCGFGDVSYFNRAFRRHFGAAPSDVRAQARGSLHRDIS